MPTLWRRSTTGDARAGCRHRGGPRGYQPSWLRGDLAAGVTTAAVVIPQSMAYATIAGLPVRDAGHFLSTTGEFDVDDPALTAAAVGGAAGDSSRDLVCPRRTDRAAVVPHRTAAAGPRSVWPGQRVRHSL